MSTGKRKLSTAPVHKAVNNAVDNALSRWRYRQLSGAVLPCIPLLKK